MTEVTKEFVQKNEDEKIIEIEIERLRSFKNHPFQVKDDNEMHLLKESIEKYGILTPLIVRPVPDMIQFLSVTHKYIEFRGNFSTNIITMRRKKRFMRWTNLSVSRNIGIWESVQNIAE